MDMTTYLIFAATTFFVVLSPGPSAIMVAAMGAANGRRAAFGIFGITCATSVYYILSATGIASLIIASNTLFMIIKWLGVGYLSYLGLSAILSKTGGFIVPKAPHKKARSALFTQGFIVEFANPKALLFFAALLPQFINTTAPIAPQFALMGTTGVALQWLIYGAYGILGIRLSRGNIKRWVLTAINKTAGGALLFASFKMARVSANN